MTPWLAETRARILDAIARADVSALAGIALELADQVAPLVARRERDAERKRDVRGQRRTNADKRGQPPPLSPPPSPGTPNPHPLPLPPLHAGRFDGPALAAYLALRAAASSASGFDHGVLAVVEPISGGVRYPWPVVGRALVELHAVGGKASPATLRAFCRRLLNDDANPGGEKRGASKQERGRAALADFMRRHDGEHGDGGAVPGVVPRALPHPRRDGADGGGVDGCAA